MKRLQTWKWHVVAVVALTAAAVDAVSAGEPFETTVEKEGFAASCYNLPGATKPVGLVVLGGSEGGQATHRARSLASQGFAVLSLAYFKAPGTPDFLDQIPLEYFDKPLEWFAAHDGMQGKKIVIVGGSKGAELALLLASRKPAIAGVIAISPSSVVFQGIPQSFWPPRSSWTFGGDPLPFVPYDPSRGVDVKHLRPLYEASLSHEELVELAAIPVERINGPVLLLSGADDRMWPASEMADAIIERLDEHKFPNWYKHVRYEDAGHTLNEHFMIGGTRDGNERARIDAWQVAMKFLSEQFSDDEPSNNQAGPVETEPGAM